MLPCTYCGEQIAEDSTVCPYCGAFEPFSGVPAEAYAEPEPGGAEDARDGFFKGLLKDCGCNLAFGCGGIFVLVVVIALVSVIATFCGGGGEGEYGYAPEMQEINCQEFLDAAVESSVDYVWGDDEVEVFSIRANLERDRIDWEKQVCPGIAETSGGKYEVWYFVTDSDDGEWTLEYEMRRLQS